VINDILLYGGASIAALYLGVRVVRRFYKFPAPSFTLYFLDSRLRTIMQPSDEIIERGGIKKGMTVMDLGCGPGIYSIDVARAVGDKGKVYAVDIQKAMIDRLEKKLKKPENKDVHNITPTVASVYRLPVPDNSVDLVYMITVLAEIPNKQKALKEIRRILRDDGILAVSEFFTDPDYPLRRTTKKWCESTGFKLKKSRGNFFNYTLQFEKSPE
jgi:ubiquinone/menaquinone biosynthesis C-methylase UbiE